MVVIDTDRLNLRHLNQGDAGFMFKLFNDPSWIQYIGDRNINTVQDSLIHMNDKYISSYGENGFGLFLVELKENAEPVGVCGLIKRPVLEDVDIGFAFLPEYTGKGYAIEAAKATMQYGYNRLGLKRIVAITIPSNTKSINLLEKLGFTNSGKAGLPDDEECILFVPS